MTKQSAVEWLVGQILERNKHDVCFDIAALEEFAFKAKEMEKQNIIEAVKETLEDANLYESFQSIKSGEDYYNQTFKPE